MKKLLIVLLAMLMLTACGKEAEEPSQPAQTTAPTYSNEGPEGVQEENMPTTLYKLTKLVVMDENGQEKWRREYIYDASGFCTTDAEYTADGQVTYRNVHTPDENGRTAKSEYVADGISFTTEYRYDEQGNVIYQGNSQDGNLQDYAEYTYDDRGNYLTMKQYYLGELAMDYSFRYTYGEDGRLLTQEEYDQGQLMNTITFTYDDQGREISTESVDGAGNVLSRTVSTWESLTETREYYGMEDTEPYLVSVITYDGHGNVILEQSQYTGGEFSLKEYTYEPFEVTK